MSESVSVIIPTYNRATQLVNAIQSVLHQSYAAHEILVCDDGSTDESKKLVSQMGYSKISFLECGRNGRPAVPRNIGIEKSSGDWIAFLDDDDLWRPEKLERQIAFAIRNNASFVCTNGIIAGTQRLYTDFSSDEIATDDLLRSNFVLCSSVLIRRSLLDVLRFPASAEFRSLEDYMLWLMVSCYSSLGFLDQPMVVYHDAPEQSVRAKGVETWQQRKIIFENLTGWAEENHLEQSIIEKFRGEYQKAVTDSDAGFFLRLYRKYKSTRH